MTFRTRAGLAAILLLYLASALAFVSRPGIEADEALAANPATFSLGRVPLMDMSYVGALKKWVILPWFALVKPGAVTLRLPSAIAATAALVLFFLLLDRSVGRRAAWIGTALLATDSMYVILNAIDFGPNAYHFVLKLGGMLLVLRFSRTARLRDLAAGFFLFGVGLWDKTIFAWALFGAGMATIALFPREVFSRLTFKNLSVATAALLVGALPLILYNIARPLDTFRANLHANRDPLMHKVDLLEYTLEGAAMFAFFTAADEPPKPGEAVTIPEKLSRGISEGLHHPLRNWTIPALCAACLGLFAKASRRAVAFGLLAMLGTWLPMLAVNNAGGAAHHVILLFPFQYFTIAAALAAIPWRAAALALTVALCAASLAVTNEYHWELVRNGPAIRWTTAIFPLEERVEKMRARRIYVADWGFYESLLMLTEAAVPIDAPDYASAKSLEEAVSDPSHVFIGHTAPFTYMPQQRAALGAAAAQLGLEEEVLETIYDRNGRPTFELFRFRKVSL